MGNTFGPDGGLLSQQRKRGPAADHDREVRLPGILHVPLELDLVARRIFGKAVAGRNGCIIWTGFIHPTGYGRVMVGGRRMQAHRASYEATVGPIPEGLHIDHVCHSVATDCAGGRTCIHRRCINPAHLLPVTPAENLGRGVQARRTHCPQGHEYTPENTYLRKDRAEGTQRQCRACTIARARRQEDRRKAARNA